MVDTGGFVCIKKNEGSMVAALQENQERNITGSLQESHRVPEREAEQASGDHGMQANIDERSLE